ncbi:hypothetical protein HDV06_000135 [Boothiomyces sp. JEL0866]|nr:hypothetical protein HDV06_000135 [Boothiomyces sp. JEL0866]
MLKNTSLLVSHTWRKCALEILNRRLEEYSKVLNEYQKSSATPELINVFENESKGKSFTAWILGNFEHPAESQVFTGIEIVIDGFNVQKCSLVFKPTGNATFGMFVDQLGYVPITSPYEWNSFNFRKTVAPVLQLWFHTSNDQDSPNIIQSNNVNSKLPVGTTSLTQTIGVHKMNLKDDIGYLGFIEYEITSTGLLESNMEIPSGAVGESILQFYQQEELKVNGKIKSVHINPQVLFSKPL